MLTLICAVIEDVEGLHRCRAPLLVTKDQIDPLVKVSRYVLRLLQKQMQSVVVN